MGWEIAVEGVGLGFGVKAAGRETTRLWSSDSRTKTGGLEAVASSQVW